MEQGLSGALEAPSAYFMKSPPRQFTDYQGKDMLEEFIKTLTPDLSGVS
jgi:myo-inositol-1-phosphate synthase